MRRFDDGVRPVRDDDAALRRAAALFDDDLAGGGGHLEAVDHHEGTDLEMQVAAAELQHLVDVRVFEIEPAGQFVVFLIEGAAGDEDADGCHLVYARGSSHFPDSAERNTASITAILAMLDSSGTGTSPSSCTARANKSPWIVY